MSISTRNPAGRARRLRLGTAVAAGAAALAMTAAGAATAQAATAAVPGRSPSSGGATANAAIHPDTPSFLGFEAIFVAADGHIRDIDPNNTVENHGPSILTGSSNSAAIAGDTQGGFSAVFRSDESGGELFQGNNNGFQQFGQTADPNTTPALAVARDDGFQEIAWANAGRLVLTRRDFNGDAPFVEGGIRSGSSPAVAAFPGGLNEFVLAWVDPNGVLNFDDGTGVHTVLTAAQPGGASADAHVRAGTSPSVAAFGNHWEIDWQDVSGHLVKASSGPVTVTESAQTLVGSPSVAALSTGIFITATENPNGDLFVNGVDEHQSDEQGNNPAIAGDGSGGWKVVFEGPDLFVHSLDSTNHTHTFNQVHVSSDASPAITALFAGN
ncbi:MAG TPA: hypothetical protein VGX23_00700 [Actinocrinis sp.]|nr:hypothetical protein [Actinocrinis sp.]